MSKYLLTILIFLILLLLILTTVMGYIAIPLQDLHFSNPIFELRIAKAITALLAGALLATSGLILQTYFTNPLAGPFVLGIDSGSTFCVALFLLIGSSTFGIISSSLLGACLVVLIIGLLIGHRVRRDKLLIIGLLFGYLTSAFLNLLITITDAEKLKSFLIWGLGSFERTLGSDLLLFSIFSILALLLSIFLIKPLNALLLGQRYAKSIGMLTLSTKLFILFTAALLSSIVTAFCGPLAFVGMIVPHIARSLSKTSNHRITLPLSMLIGSNLTLLTLLITSLSPLVLPVNAILGMMGGPFLIYILIKERGER